MIRLLLGENSFEIQRFIQKLKANYSGEVLQVEGIDLSLTQLPDLITGMSLFSSERLIIIRGLSDNKSLWAEFYNWIPRISTDSNIILIETKPDKRTATFKELKKIASIQEFPVWGDRDESRAHKWAVDEAKELGYDLSLQHARLVTQRIGLDQWSLYNGLVKLSLLDEISNESIIEHIDANPTENVFNLFETALRGDSASTVTMLKTLELTEEPYRLFALLASQVVQLAAISHASPQDNVAKDFSVHPYVVSKLSNLAQKKSKSVVRKILNEFALTDDDMKTTGADPWILIERTLLRIASY